MAVSSFPHGLGARMGAGGGLSVQTPAVNLTNVHPGAVYSGIKFEADGSVYEHRSSGGTSWYSISTWLLDGAAEDAWIIATNSGSGLYLSSALSTRLQLNAARYWRLRDVTSFGPPITSTLNVKIYDAETGGNLLAERNYSLSAWYSDL